MSRPADDTSSTLAPAVGASVGVVRPQRAVVATAADPLELACGRALEHVEVAYETYGELNADADNAVVLLHALTADAHAAGCTTTPARWGGGTI